MKHYLFFTLGITSVLMTGCSEGYEIDSEFTGIVQEIDDERLTVVEENTLTTYEIPLPHDEPYQVGQFVRITVYSDTDQDIWDPKHMRFKIDSIAQPK